MAFFTLQLSKSYSYVFFCRKSTSSIIVVNISKYFCGYGLIFISWFNERTAHFRCGRLNPTCPAGTSGWCSTANIKCCDGPVVTSTYLKIINITDNHSEKRYDALHVGRVLFRVENGAVLQGELIGWAPCRFDTPRFLWEAIG